MSKKFNLNQLLSGTSLNATERDAAAEETPRRPPLKVVSLSVHDLIPSKDNFYSVDNIAELKTSINMFGVKSNLTVKPLENGKYEVIAGHRRRLACLALVEEGKTEFEYVPCGIESERDEIKENILLIMMNSTARELSEWEKTQQATELRKHFEILKKRESLPGRVRDLVAEALNTSATQVGRMDAISNNLSDEFKDEFKEGRLGMSAAYELSGLPEEEQKKAFDEYGEKGGLSVNDVKAKKEGMKAAEERKPDPPTIPPFAKGSDITPDAPPFHGSPADEKEFITPPRETENPTERAEDKPPKPEKRDFADFSVAEKADSAVELLNFYRFAIFQPSEDTRLYDFIIDALEYYKNENGDS